MINPYAGFLIGCAIFAGWHAFKAQSLLPLAIVALLAFMLKPFLPPRD